LMRKRSCCAGKYRIVKGCSMQKSELDSFLGTTSYFTDER
jgi:hypothetical protein